MACFLEPLIPLQRKALNWKGLSYTSLQKDLLTPERNQTVRLCSQAELPCGKCSPLHATRDTACSYGRGGTTQSGRGKELTKKDLHIEKLQKKHLCEINNCIRPRQSQMSVHLTCPNGWVAAQFELRMEFLAGVEVLREGGHCAGDVVAFKPQAPLEAGRGRMQQCCSAAGVLGDILAKGNRILLGSTCQSGRCSLTVFLPQGPLLMAPFPRQHPLLMHRFFHLLKPERNQRWMNQVKLKRNTLPKT